MNDYEMHQLRNAVNVLLIGLPLLRRQLGKTAPPDVTETLSALQAACERCRKLTAAPLPIREQATSCVLHDQDFPH